MEFEREKETFLQKIAFPCVAIAGLAPMVVGAGVGYFALDFFGRVDLVNTIWQKPMASLSLNDLMTVASTFVWGFLAVWIGKEVGLRAIQATSDWFEEKEKSARSDKE